MHQSDRGDPRWAQPCPKLKRTFYMTLHVTHLDDIDFPDFRSHCDILHTRAEPNGTVIETAAYNGADNVLVQLPNGSGYVVQETEAGEVGIHEMARDALALGLLDRPAATTHQANDIRTLHTQPTREVDLDDVPAPIVEALNTLNFVDLEAWVSELERTRVIQTDDMGAYLVHLGVRDDGHPVQLIQIAGSNLHIVILLPIPL
jgi:hypothetical protein